MGRWGRCQRVEDNGRVHIHDHDRLTGVSRLRESVEVGQIQAGISPREAEIGAGVMVQHWGISFSFCQ